MENNTLRAIDANLNRVGEGLRVVEDICRFIMSNGGSQQRLKTMRHRLRTFTSGKKYIKHRNSVEDVGIAAEGKMEYHRRDTGDLLQANFKRVQEGLRALEELFKLEDPTVSKTMKEMRYESYDMERSLWARIEKKKLRKGLYLVLTEPPGGYEALTEMAVKAGIPAVQLRYKGDDEKMLFSLAKNMREITRNSNTLFIVNDRPDIALMAEADGVHVGQEDLPVKDIRRLIGPEMLLGLSTHNIDQVLQSNDEPVDYIGFGPIYTTNSKDKPDPVTGSEMLMKAGRIARHPIVAIGGLTTERIGRLDPHTYNNVAVIRAVTLAEDPLHAMKAIHKGVTEMI